jgi:BRO1-like domain
MRAQARECIFKRLQIENSRDFETLLIETKCLMNEYNKIHYDIQSNAINFPACWEALIPLKTEYFKALMHVYYAKNIAKSDAQKNEIADEKSRLKTMKAHLQVSQSSHEEILRLQRMCRELRVSAF